MLRLAMTLSGSCSLAACTLLVSTTGLSDGSGTTPGDSGSTEVATVDAPAGEASIDGAIAAPSCDPNKPFGALTPFAQPVNSNGSEYAGSLSQDLLQFVFARDDELYGSVRITRDGPWSVPIPLTTINTSARETNPSLPPSYLTLVFDSNRPGATFGQGNLWIARRGSLTSFFSPPSPIEGVNSDAEEIEPWLSADEQRLYFASDRGAGMDIYVATKTGASSYGTPVRIDELAGEGGTEAPVLTADELTIYFSSTRPGSKAQDVWVATRPSPTAKFGTPALMSGFNSNVDDYPTWVSADGCRVVIQSYSSGNSDLYFAERPK